MDDVLEDVPVLGQYQAEHEKVQRTLHEIVRTFNARIPDTLIMVFDIAWNLFRKALCPDLYARLRSSPLGRPRNYHSIETFKAIFEHYQAVGFDFRGKRILEVGSGLQYFTSFYFLAAGAKSVSLVEPLLPNNASTLFKEQLEAFRAQNSGTPANFSEALVHGFQSLAAVPTTLYGSVDIACSHFVLEHFRDLDEFFRITTRLLADDGECYCFVDLSDHAYHVFDSRQWTRWLYRTRMLYHLRYSNETYDRITDSRIWVNRLLLPSYRAMAAKYGFSVHNVQAFSSKKPRIHRDVLEKNATLQADELNVTHFGFHIRKEGAGTK